MIWRKIETPFEELVWVQYYDKDAIVLDGNFTLDELVALVEEFKGFAEKEKAVDCAD